jgi:drug/metabolite transporter (DMT)-like permease
MGVVASELATRAEIAAPSRTDLGLIAVAVGAVSTSGPLIAATAAPALAIAFWRNGFAALVLAPVALARRRAAMRAMVRREWWLIGLAGVLLAAHFAVWVTSLRYTSVATSTALVATQPVWAGLLARARGASISRAAWIGIAVAVVAAGLLTGLDLRLSGRAVVGDFLALAGAVFAAGYVTVGAQVRRSVDTTSYTTLCYSMTAVLLLMVCAIGGQSLAGYSGDDWLRILALTAGAQLLGHSVFNRVLKTTSPTVVSLAILFEVPGAALIAAVFLHQPIHVIDLPAAALLLTGLALVIRAGATAIPAE